MGSNTEHYDDELQEALDERLPADRRAELEAHLAACERCRRQMDALRWVKQLAKAAPSPVMPVSLESDIARALDEEDGQAPPVATAVLRGRWRPAWVLAGVAALLLIVFYSYWTRPRSDLPSAVAGDYRDYRAGALGLGLETDDVSRMEQYFSEEGVPFQTRVFDLGMMRYRLQGGRVHRLGGRTSALFVYRREDGHTVVCQMYPGNLGELPAPSERREHDGITFRVYRQDALTLAFWQEGEITCVLAADGDPEGVVQLAFAKAMKVA